MGTMTSTASLVGWVEERNPTFTDIGKWQYGLQTGHNLLGFAGLNLNLRKYDQAMARGAWGLAKATY